MTFSQALETVSRDYIPGVVDHYATMPSDPWQAAHDALEESIGQAPEIREAACHAFVQRCRELIQAYKLQRPPPAKPTVRDAFAAGDPDRVRQWKSVRDKTCFFCEGMDHLTLVNDPQDIRKAKIVCEACKKAKAIA